MYIYYRPDDVVDAEDVFNAVAAEPRFDFLTGSGLAVAEQNLETIADDTKTSS